MIGRGTSAVARGRSLCGSNSEPSSIQCAIDGSVAEVACQYTGADQDHDILKIELEVCPPKRGIETVYGSDSNRTG